MLLLMLGELHAINSIHYWGIEYLKYKHFTRHINRDIFIVDIIAITSFYPFSPCKIALLFTLINFHFSLLHFCTLLFVSDVNRRQCKYSQFPMPLFKFSVRLPACIAFSRPLEKAARKDLLVHWTYGNTPSTSKKWKWRWTRSLSWPLKK